MRNKQAILDEAARSVRRTFIGSVSGSVAMLAVVGAAGAYGMPEKLTAKAFTLAMAKLNVKLPQEAAVSFAAVERPVQVAQNIASPAVMPVSDAIPDQPVVKPAPQVSAPAVTPPPAPVTAPRETVVTALPPVAPAAPVVAPRETIFASVPPSAPVIETAPAVAEPTPAPATTASFAPRAIPDEKKIEQPFIAAPLVFGAPKSADVQTFSELPRTETVISPAAAEAHAMATPEPVELPKSLMLRLPLPKPPLTPAQRLELQGKDYDKAEKCLAQAIYFEARAEPARGQQAVAQVVLNRVFSPYYPKDVCSVVYQNAHRHLSCQFTFACDGKPETVNERGSWARANRIAKETLAAKIWLPEVAKATHYHASYVHPAWAREMKVMAKYGLHTFYRPRNWGDGRDEPAWGAGAVKKTAAKS